MSKTEFIHYPKLDTEQLGKYKESIFAGIEHIIQDLNGRNPSDIQVKRELRREVDRFLQLQDKLKSRAKHKETDSVELGTLLKMTGVPILVAEQVKTLVDQVKADLTQTYAPNLTESQISAIESEGRGFYRKHTVKIPGTNGRTHQIINYIKGAGAKNLVLTAKHDFLCQ